MSKDSSINAVKSAIGGGETYSGYADIHVSAGRRDIVYSHVYTRVSYHYGYMQMNVDIQWDDDRSAPDYNSLGLHKGYNTNFQSFEYRGGNLIWSDNGYEISARLK